MPDWARPAVRPLSPRWPENQQAFAVEVASEDGDRGLFGPCARATVDIVLDQLAEAVVGTRAGEWRLQGTAAAGRHRTGAHFRVALSALELASWDLRSRVEDVPVTDLLGGAVVPRVRAYASALGVDVEHPLAPEVAKWLAEEGFYGQKWALRMTGDADVGAALAALGRIRAAIGDARLFVDAVGTWPRDVLLLALPALEELGIAWVEEPFGPGRRVGMVPRGVPIAGGEHSYDPETQVQQLSSGELDVWQPDVGWHGGLDQTLWAARLAASFGIRVFPHGGCLPGALAVGALLGEAVVPAIEYHLTIEALRQTTYVREIVPLGGWIEARRVSGLTDGYLVAEEGRRVGAMG